MNVSILTASHCGIVHFGDFNYEAVMLTTGERGYARKELAKLLGFHELHKGDHFTRFLADIAPNSLFLLEKSSGPTLLPSGRQTQFSPAGIITDAATLVMDIAVVGMLHHARQGIIGNCLAIIRVLTTIGEVALIDETTGHQHHRTPSALQELISKLLRQSYASWERRSRPDYYRTIYRLFGWKYQGYSQNPPHVASQTTLCWVYESMLPEDLSGEIYNRKGTSQKHHQWLSDQGLAHLESQIHAVTTIARSSVSYPDLKRHYEAVLADAAL